jgi:hypothetical protein
MAVTIEQVEKARHKAEDAQIAFMEVAKLLNEMRPDDETEPTDPVDPTDPTDPTDPIGGDGDGDGDTDPTDPTDPVDPGTPIPPLNAGPAKGWHLPVPYAEIGGKGKAWDGKSKAGRPGEYNVLKATVRGETIVLTGDGASKANPTYFVLPDEKTLVGCNLIIRGDGVSVYGRLLPQTEVTIDGEQARLLGVGMGGITDPRGMLNFTKNAKDFLAQYASFGEQGGKMGAVTHIGDGFGIGFSRCFFKDPQFTGEGPMIYVGTQIGHEKSNFGFWMDECLVSMDKENRDAVEGKSSKLKVTRNTLRGGVKYKFKQRHGLLCVYDLNYLANGQGISARGEGHQITRNKGPKSAFLGYSGTMPPTGGSHEPGGGRNWQALGKAKIAANDLEVILGYLSGDGKFKAVDNFAPTSGPSKNRKVTLQPRSDRTKTEGELPGVLFEVAEKLVERRQNQVGHLALMEHLRQARNLA